MQQCFTIQHKLEGGGHYSADLSATKIQVWNPTTTENTFSIYLFDLILHLELDCEKNENKQ